MWDRHHLERDTRWSGGGRSPVWLDDEEAEEPSAWPEVGGVGREVLAEPAGGLDGDTDVEVAAAGVGHLVGEILGGGGAVDDQDPREVVGGVGVGVRVGHEDGYRLGGWSA